MAAFDSTAELSHPVDYRLVVNGFVTLFWAQSVLDSVMESLSAIGYQLVTLQAGEVGLDVPEEIGGVRAAPAR